MHIQNIQTRARSMHGTVVIGEPCMQVHACTIAATRITGGDRPVTAMTATFVIVAVTTALQRQSPYTLWWLPVICSDAVVVRCMVCTWYMHGNMWTMYGWHTWYMHDVCFIQDGNARLFHYLAWIPQGAINDSRMILDASWVIHWWCMQGRQDLA